MSVEGDIKKNLCSMLPSSHAFIGSDRKHSRLHLATIEHLRSCDYNQNLETNLSVLSEEHLARRRMKQDGSYIQITTLSHPLGFDIAMTIMQIDQY